MPPQWFEIGNVGEIDSPALAIYCDRVEQNIERMIAIAGNPAKLRPHIKTHKLAEVVRMQIARGITRFKGATIAEVEMAAEAGAPDVLLAYQPAGPKADRLIALAKKFPRTKFSALIDDADVARALSANAQRNGVGLGVFMDLDCGQHRTGIAPGERAVELYRLISNLPGLRAAGLQAYDGHIHDSDVQVRRKKADDAFEPVAALRAELQQAGLEVPTIVLGGTPTFPMSARRENVECSPGTCVLWDFGYASTLSDLDFLISAVLVTRVVSKPNGSRVCLDLGHKAVASENPHPRVQFLNLPDANAVTHSEEHLVIETTAATSLKIGDVLYAVPRHVCPTVALHSEVVVVENGVARETWKVRARDRRLTV